MPGRHITLKLASPDQTCAFARRLARVLRPGDVLLLEGGIGAGKTHFARCAIQSRLAAPEDVPSPTFTLVQTYPIDAGEIWHADLYRVGGPDELVELGLTEAFESAICLVEWPDRMGDLAPETALRLRFDLCDDDAARHVDLTWDDPRWDFLNEKDLHDQP